VKKRVAVAAIMAVLAMGSAPAKELKSIGISLGSLGNPYFVALAKGAEAEAKKSNPNVRVTTVGFDYDLNKQFTQIDNFIAAGVDMILLNPGDPNAIEPAIKRAQAAGIIVIAVDAAAKGADLTVTTDNVQAGRLSCQYIADSLHGKGDVIIENGPQVTAVTDRVKGCKEAFAKAPGLKVLSADQDGKGSRDGAFAVMQGYLTRFPKIDAVFAINDPQGIGSDLAAKQLGRKDLIITSVDGAPDIEVALKSKDSLIRASASQDPYAMAALAVKLGVETLGGKKPAQTTVLMPSKLLTRENIGSYQGWSAPRS